LTSGTGVATAVTGRHSSPPGGSRPTSAEARRGRSGGLPEQELLSRRGGGTASSSRWDAPALYRLPLLLPALGPVLGDRRLRLVLSSGVVVVRRRRRRRRGGPLVAA
jgi:hypothetical protein